MKRARQVRRVAALLLLWLSIAAQVTRAADSSQNGHPRSYNYWAAAEHGWTSPTRGRQQPPLRMSWVATSRSIEDLVPGARASDVFCSCRATRDDGDPVKGIGFDVDVAIFDASGAEIATRSDSGKTDSAGNFFYRWAATEMPEPVYQGWLSYEALARISGSKSARTVGCWCRSSHRDVCSTGSPARLLCLENGRYAATATIDLPGQGTVDMEALATNAAGTGLFVLPGGQREEGRLTIRTSARPTCQRQITYRSSAPHPWAVLIRDVATGRPHTIRGTGATTRELLESCR